MNRLEVRLRGLILGLFMAIASGAWTCPVSSKPAPEPAVLEKIGFDLDLLDENGLYGSRGSRRSLEYEFCIPAKSTAVAEVEAIDSSVVIYEHSSGRIGCTDEQFLAIGNTQQENPRRVLLELANLDYIARIQEVFWE